MVNCRLENLRGVTSKEFLNIYERLSNMEENFDNHYKNTGEGLGKLRERFEIKPNGEKGLEEQYRIYLNEKELNQMRYIGNIDRIQRPYRKRATK